jgi:hydroxyethylthiazole kinase-like uncharacterized protein yjeF
VVEAVFEEWPELAEGLPIEEWLHGFNEGSDAGLRFARRAVVLCGPGNNGGDGFVVARLLKERNWEVEVFFYGQEDQLGADARQNYDRWVVSNKVIALGFPVLREGEVEDFWKKTNGSSGTSLIIDALFGLGLNRPLKNLRPLLEEIEHYQFLRTDPHPIAAPRCVAVDVPSGMDSDSGEATICDPVTSLYFLAIHADMTVTFHRKKLGHSRGHAEYLCGKTVVKDIGL